MIILHITSEFARFGRGILFFFLFIASAYVPLLRL